jgi:hypothetical protein
MIPDSKSRFEKTVLELTAILVFSINCDEDENLCLKFKNSI